MGPGSLGCFGCLLAQPSIGDRLIDLGKDKRHMVDILPERDSLGINSKARSVCASKEKAAPGHELLYRSHPGQALGREQLSDEFFSDPSHGWDNKSNKNYSKAPNHNTTEWVSWIESWLNPESAAMRQGRARSAGHVEWDANQGAPRQEYNGVAGLNGMYLSVQHCNGWSGQALSRQQLWQEFVSDPLQWWDNRSDKKNAKAPDFRHKITKEVLWINSWLNPPWVKSELVDMTEVEAQSGDSSDYGVGHRGSGREYNGLAGLYRTQLSVQHQRGCIDNSSITNPTFERTCVVRYNTLVNVRTLCKDGRLKEAMHILDVVDQQGIKISSDTYICLLQGCINTKALTEGKRIHFHIVKSGFKPNIFLGNTLVHMYIKCGSLIDARQVFDKMPERNEFTWTIMIAGYTQNGKGKEALALFGQMEQEGVKPDKVTFVSIIKACVSILALEQGKQIHAHIIKSGFELDVFVASSLVDMYAKCGSIKHARQVFDKMPARDVVSWTAMIAGYAQHEQGEEALELFWQMKGKGVKPNKVTYVSILKACACIAALEQGKQIHIHIIKNGFESDIAVGSSLVDMYSKCGSIEHAWQVFNKMPKRDVVAWNAMIAGSVQHGQGEKSFQLLRQLELEGVKPDQVTFVSILKGCTSIATGKQIHAHIIKSGFASNVFVGSSLVGMYAKSGSIEHARQVFDGMVKRDVVLWNAMITAHAQHGQGKEALELFWKMDRKGAKPDQVTFVNILKVCVGSLAALEQGKRIHAHIIKSGFESDVTVVSNLVGMYAKCGSIEYARQVFDEMPERDVVLWSAMIAVYAQHGQGEEALELFQQMIQEGTKPDKSTFLSILKACTSIAALEQGKQIHDHIIKSGFESDVVMGSTLVNMYAKCGSIEHARRVFDKMAKQDVVSWTAMIAGYVQHRQSEQALELFRQMEMEGVKPDVVTFVTILKACGNIAALEQGKQVHANIICCGFELDVTVGSTLVGMYAKCGKIDHARHVFDNLPERDRVSWTAMIAGYAQHGLGEEALELFQQMEREGMKADDMTFVSILKACASIGALERGKEIHAHIIENQFESNVVVGNTLIDMYAKCGSIELACGVFNEMPKRDVVAWNAMIAGYVQHGLDEEALELFWRMELEGIMRDEVTFVNILKLCSSVSALECGKKIHTQIIRSGFESNIIVGSTLVDMYAKCGNIEDARQLFDDLPGKDVILWNAMIAGYAQNGKGQEALELFWQIEQESLKPNEVTFACILKVCSSLAALEQGKQIHAYMIKSGLNLDVTVGSALVGMYAKCGSITHARRVFDEMPKRDAISCNAMLAGYAQHGHAKEALQLVEQMQHEGLKLDDITFICIFSACCHAGLVVEGQHYFDSMSRDHGITPTDKHYACMVDLLGRVGRLKEAEDFIQRMPLQPSAVVWSTLLGACRIHGNVELAKHAAECIFELDPHNSAAFVLLSNIYAAAGKYDKAEVREMMEDKCVKKARAQLC